MWRTDVFKVLPLVSNKVLLVEPGPYVLQTSARAEGPQVLWALARAWEVCIQM